MLNVEVCVTDVSTQEVIKNVVQINVPFEIEVLLSTDHPIAPEHEKEIDDEVINALQNYLNNIKLVIWDFFKLEYEVLPRILN